MQPIPATSLAPELDAPERWGRTAVAWRIALIAGWLSMLAIAVCFGARQSTFSSLQAAIEAGQVHEVQVTNGAPITNGQLTVDLFWRRGALRYTTSVIETSSSGSFDLRDGVTDVVPFAAADELRSAGVDVQVRSHGRLSGGLLGWRVPQWSLFVLLLLGVATLASLLSSPQPWGASRWGWFWLMTTGHPVGLIAYLLLAGPVPFSRPWPKRRLTGGRALVLSIGISIVASLISAFPGISV